ncbi:MAG: SIMPL domain-containing protein [Chloroflexota bacterium]
MFRTRVRATWAAFALTATLATSVVLMSMQPPTARAAPQAADDLRSTVTVVGDGRVTVQPDLATITFSVEANAPTLAEAQADASTRMQSVIDALTGQGIARDDIRTSRLSANPVYDEKDRTVITGYRANNSVQVKLRDLSTVGQVVDSITAAGANRVDGLSFSVENIEEPKNQARAQAMQNARVKADQLASLAGMRVTGVKSIQESDASSPPVPYAAAAPARAEAAAPPVEPGTQEVRTQVTVTYIME